MPIRTISHVELYVVDEVATLAHLRDAFGFTPTARRQTNERRSTLLRAGIDLIVTAPLARGPVSQFLDAHGDGVADLAFVCDDPAESAARALAAGAEPHPAGTLGAAALTGFGDVRHSLLGPEALAPHWLPSPGWRKLAVEAPTRGTELTLDHVAVVLAGGTLRDTTAFYHEAYGCEWFSGEYVEVGRQAMDSIVVKAGDGVTFTMIEPVTDLEPGQIDRFLDGNGGPGVQHLAFGVSDIVGQVRRLAAEGVAFAPTPDTYYDDVAARVGDLSERLADLRDTGVLADRDEWGYLLQIFTLSPYRRKTLFFELIQRHEARGFGSANIRALYEAVERARALADVA